MSRSAKCKVFAHSLHASELLPRWEFRNVDGLGQTNI